MAASPAAAKVAPGGSCPSLGAVVGSYRGPALVPPRHRAGAVASGKRLAALPSVRSSPLARGGQSPPLAAFAGGWGGR